MSNTSDNKCWQERGERQKIMDCWLQCLLTQPLWKTVRAFHKKLEIELP